VTPGRKSNKPKLKIQARIVPRISGSGSYKAESEWGKWATKAGGLGGDLLSHIFGNGDYKLKYNTLMDAGGPPQFSGVNSDRSTVIRHREYVSDVLSSTGFVITSYPITMSNVNLFPWLNSLGSNYEQYRIHGMIFEFKSTSGSAIASTNNALGTVIMGTQYDVDDVPFANKLQMENSQYTTSSAPSVSFLHGVECALLLTVAPVLYTDGATQVGAVRDLRFTQFCNFSIATVGQQAASVNLGELWISYEIELLKPKLSASLDVSSAAFYSASPTTGNFLGATMIYDSGGVGGTVTNDESNGVFSNYAFTANTITFTDPRLSGRALFIASQTNATTIAGSPSVTAISSGTIAQTAWATSGTTSAASGQFITLQPNVAGTWTLTFSAPAFTGAAISRFWVSLWS
jgi:hypothetical protein